MGYIEVVLIEVVLIEVVLIEVVLIEEHLEIFATKENKDAFYFVEHGHPLLVWRVDHSGRRGVRLSSFELGHFNPRPTVS